MVYDSVLALLRRYDAGQVTRHHLVHGKDNSQREGCENTLSHWLYRQHHPGSEKWKLQGQRFWSVEAWLSLRGWRKGGRGGYPKQGDGGLRSEHVVPKKVMKEEILRDRKRLRFWLERNLCCVVTTEQDMRLPRTAHPDPSDPWRRYKGLGITLLHNRGWTVEETSALLRHELLNERSVDPF